MPRRNPFDYFGCPEFMVVITRWDGKDTKPVEVFRSYAEECTWDEAASGFAKQLRESAKQNKGALRPKLRRALHVDSRRR